MMIKSVFGELNFSTGWKTQSEILLFGSNYSVTVKAKAYFEKDGITPEQEKAFSDFIDNRQERLRIAEKHLNEFAKNNAAERFTPRVLLFLRDGEYSLLLDDKNDRDGGIAARLSPEVEIISQDEYL